MGVQGLWDLVAPVGRRVSVETLAGKRLAIDASIWMIQFMKAMRDEQGEMVRNAHLLGFFRRICKLLFLRIKPVFVFDGGTPALKWRTVNARRKQRDDAQAKVRKTAEKMLLNQLKKTRLKELQKELKDQRIKKDSKGKSVAESEADSAEKSDAREGWLNQEKIDEMLAASLAAEEGDMHNNGASTSSDAFHGQDSGPSSNAFCGQDRGPSTSAFANFVDDEEDEDDEEMILPMTNGKIDPTVLAALPPSMQLDLLVQMRERLMAENRQKYQKVKKAPQKFSELQIETYLKTVAFRREIDEVQKAASGKGVGGLQTARIASEGNKEFIFSSSFTGDKQALASASMNKTAENQDGAKLEHSTPTTSIASAPTPSFVSVPSGNEATPSSGNETRADFGSDVQTYCDERGHMRLSRLRAMGIRMTRDLQRNLDLMKEIEQELINVDVPANIPVNPAEKDMGSIKIILDNFSEGSGEKSSTTEKRNKHRPMSNIETSLEISFEEDGQCLPVDDDDDFFARLVAGDPVPISSAGDTASKDHNLESDSDCEWEEGTILTEIPSLLIEQVESAPAESQFEERNNDETNLQWEDGTNKIPEDASSCPAVSMDLKSRGSIEEEAALQEAIQRSLDDLKGEMDASSKFERGKKVFCQVSEAPSNQSNKIDVSKNGSIHSSVSGPGLLDDMAKRKSSDIVCFPHMIPMPSADKSFANIKMEIDRPCYNHVLSDAECLVDHRMSISGETSTRSNAAVRIIEKSCNVLSDGPGENSCGTLNSHITDVALADPLNLTIEKTIETSEVVPPIWHSNEAPDVAIELEKSKEPASDVGLNRIASEEELMHGVDEKEHNLGSRDTEDEDIQLTDAHLEDEIQILDEDYDNLEDERRKLERNAASVSSEMFAECQELLQMFGLPYIIAPMEAEAQCAYMELQGLVEGVVTDDSDVFLFGACSVYKNIFDDRKYVEAYLMKDIENELGLSREKLIRMAMLLGSDYTEGVSGIGIVNAIEVVNAFPEEDGLSKFREWVESPDPTILGKSGKTRGSSSKKRGSKSSGASMKATKDSMDVISSDCDDNEKTEGTHELENIPKVTEIFMKKHRKVSKNWHIPFSFPSQAVISAYASPQVDKSTAPCSWGKPDLFVLRRLCWEKFGWASQKADDVLLPVLKEYDKHETQLRMEAFCTFNERFAKIRSKRVKQAVKGITGDQFLDSSNEPKVGGKTNKRKKSTKDTLSGEESPANIPKEPRKSKISESSREKERGSRGGAKATRGRRKAQTGGRGKRKRTSDIEFSDAESGDDDQELNFEKVEAPDRVRRSTRTRKAAKYAESDGEVHPKTQSLQDATEEERLKDQIFGEMDQSTAEDSVLDEDLCGDYLFKGGGFCAEEDQPENEMSTLKDDTAPAEIDQQYLETGGGFCFDDDDDDTNYDNAQKRTNEEIQGIVGENEDNGAQMCPNTSPIMVKCAQRVQQQHQEAQNDTASGSSSQIGKAVSEVRVDTNSPVKGLSAMPNLRRKRKKIA